MDLLKQSDGEIEKAVEVYHQNNIADIVTQTNCNQEMAEKYYKKFSFNTEKSIREIKSILSQQRYCHQTITLQDDKCHYNEVGFALYIKSKTKYLGYDNNDDYIFIPVPDCWLISDTFSTYCDDYDPCFHNDFNHEAILNVIHDLSLLTDDDKKVMQFYQEVIAWFKDKSKPDNIIEMYGNI